jgi:hypothetical protein
VGWSFDKPLQLNAMANVSELKKPDAEEMLMNLGEKPIPKMSVLEMKSRIKEILHERASSFADLLLADTEVDGCKPAETDHLNFGKHPTMTYLEAFGNSTYRTWAMKANTKRDDDVPPVFRQQHVLDVRDADRHRRMWRRFADWAKAEAVILTMVIKKEPGTSSAS